jgi:hypothetical protein
MDHDLFEKRGAPAARQSESRTESRTPPEEGNKTVNPHTRVKVILANGKEVEGVIFSYDFARYVAGRDSNEGRILRDPSED